MNVQANKVPLDQDTNDLSYMGQKIRRGLCLFKGGDGSVVVLGTQTLDLGESGKNIVVSMASLYDSSAVFRTPFPMFGKNNMRLPSDFEMVKQILKKLVEPRKPSSSVWIQRKRRFDEIVQAGCIIQTAQALSAIYSPYRGCKFDVSNRELSFSEKEYADKFLAIIADDISFSFSSDQYTPKELVKELVVHTGKTHPILAYIDTYKKEYSPYLSEGDLSKIIGNDDTQQTKLSGQTLTVGASSTSRSKNVRGSFRQSTASSERGVPEKSRLILGAPKRVVPKPKPQKRANPILKKEYADCNEALYKSFVDRAPGGSFVRGVFLTAAKHLDEKGFELHSRMYFLKGDNQSFAEVASAMKLSEEEALSIHNQSVEVLREHHEDLAASSRTYKLLEKRSLSEEGALVGGMAKSTEGTTAKVFDLGDSREIQEEDTSELSMKGCAMISFNIPVDMLKYGANVSIDVLPNNGNLEATIRLTPIK